MKFALTFLRNITKSLFMNLYHCQRLTFRALQSVIFYQMHLIFLVR